MKKIIFLFLSLILIFSACLTVGADKQSYLYFDAVGGTLSVDKLLYNESDNIISGFPIPEKDGFEFEGWYADENYSGERVTFLNVGASMPDVLYAKWKDNHFNIEYILTDRDYDIDISLVNNPNDNIRISTADFNLKSCSYDNRLFVFEGWYLDKQRTEKVDCIKAGIDGDITLYAKWCEPEFRIEYEYGFPYDKINVVNDNINSYEIGTVYTFKPCTVDGFIFNGWFSDEELKIPITDIFENTTGDIKLYASLTEKTYSVQYDMIPADTDVKDFEVYSNNPSLRTVSQGIILNEPTTFNVFYLFEGWYSDSEYKNQITEIPEYTVGNITVYAKWVKIISYVPVWGDATLSNGLTVSDARLVLKSTAKLVELDEISQKVSDINNDGIVNTKDARLILRVVAKLETADLLTQKYNLKTISVEDGKIVFK